MKGTSEDVEVERPRFGGCVFCYAGEWSYYGAKKAVEGVRSST